MSEIRLHPKRPLLHFGRRGLLVCAALGALWVARPDLKTPISEAGPIAPGSRLKAEQARTVEFAQATSFVAEASGPARVEVVLTTSDGLPAEQAVEVSAASTGGSAEPGIDYLALPPTPIRFEAGSPSGAVRAVEVEILDDRDPLRDRRCVRIVPPPDYENDSRVFRDLFERPDEWMEVRSRVDALGYYDHRVNSFGDEDLAAWFPTIREWGLEFYLETCALNEWAPTGEGCFNAVLPLWDRFVGLGATIDGFAMDEPFIKVRGFGLGSDEYAVEQTADWIRRTREVFPEAKIGSIEPYPALDAGALRWWVTTLNSRLEELGVREIDFFCLDVDWRRFSSGDGSWTAVRRFEDFLHREGIPFSLIYWGAEANVSQIDAEWGQGIMRQGVAYEAVGGRPTEFDIQSWLEIPSRSVPETDGLTFTGSVLNFLDRFVPPLEGSTFGGECLTPVGEGVMYEKTETAELALSAPTGARIGPVGGHKIFIGDDESGYFWTGEDGSILESLKWNRKLGPLPDDPAYVVSPGTYTVRANVPWTARDFVLGAGNPGGKADLGTQRIVFSLTQTNFSTSIGGRSALVNAGGVFTIGTNARVNLEGALTVDGRLEWESGILGTASGPAGTLDITPRGAMEISGEDVKTLGNIRILQSGLLIWEEGEVAQDGTGYLENRGDFEIRARNDWRVDLVNHGRILKTGEVVSILHAPADSGEVTNSGEIEVVSGTLFVEGDLVQTAGSTILGGGRIELPQGAAFDLEGGVLSGSGEFGGNLVNRSQLVPGGALGRIDVVGDYTQEPSGTLTIRFENDSGIVGTTALAVSGEARLDGSLLLAFGPGVQFEEGRRFEILRYGGHEGRFVQSQWIAPGGRYALLPQYGPESLEVMVEGPLDPPVLLDLIERRIADETDFHEVFRRSLRWLVGG